MTKQRRKATYQDVLDAPAHKVAEVVDGTLYTHPRPAIRHSLARSALGATIGGPFVFGDGGPGGWWIIDEPELHLGEDIVVPDIAGWRIETMTEDMEGDYFTQPPEWVCEVLSPTTSRLDRTKKRAVYTRERVSDLWFVDPDARILEGFELRGDCWVLRATLFDNALVSLPPFDAISFPLDRLWPKTKRSQLAETANGGRRQSA